MKLEMIIMWITLFVTITPLAMIIFCLSFRACKEILTCKQLSVGKRKFIIETKIEK